MTKLKLELADHEPHYAPGETLHGLAGWESDEPLRSVELRLLWYTEGKGTRDVHVADRRVWDSPGAIDAPLFSFDLPPGPFSFSGTLITLQWAVELVAEPGSVTERLTFTMGPGLGEIQIDSESARPWVAS